MSGPIVFISHFKIKEGKLEGLKQHAQKMVELINAEKPGTLAFLQYLNEAGSELSIVHVFSDANAFDKHGEGVAERASAGFEFLEPISAARLASKAGAGEILVSEATYNAARIENDDPEKRDLELKGKSETVHVRVLHAR
jgi:quinol monooxygenase YgiN